MKFSLATVEGKRKLCSTQAEAKELDKGFERIDIPTDHDGLKAFVQGLFDQIDSMGATPRSELASEGSSPSPPPPGDQSQHKWMGNDHLVRSGEACPNCRLTEQVSKFRAGAAAMLMIEETLWATTDADAIDRLAELIAQRRGELTDQAKG